MIRHSIMRYSRHHILTTAFVAVATLLSGQSMAQDTLWVKYNNRFLPNKQLLTISQFDSIEIRTKAAVPVLRCFSQEYSKGYLDYRLKELVGDKPGMITFDNPQRYVYQPSEFRTMDFMNENSKWCFQRSKESEHFIVFWMKEFGDNPNSSKVPSDMRVDIDDLLEKAEKFYNTNVNTLQMVNLNDGKSPLHKYKMEIYLLYQSEWLATGSGYDDKIGALWVNPSTCHPVGSTIGHEIGHTFQYQTYCDNVARGKASNHNSGFRYGLPGSNGGNGFWEQCAQWQSFQDYPSEAISTWQISDWFNNNHRHFEHEWHRYASYWLHYYITEKHGITTLGRIWNESVYPEGGLDAYLRIFLDNDYEELKKQLFEYAQHAVTFDFKAVKSYVGTKYDDYNVSFLNADDGYMQITYGKCPGPTGFNAIPLNIPASGTEIKVDFQGLAAGSPLAKGDPGTATYWEGGQKKTTTVTAYNDKLKGKEGWALGFVALQNNNTRVYGDATFTDSSASVSFTVPSDTKRLWLVVQGVPTEYRQSPWDDYEPGDDQLPYKIKIEGTTLK